MTLENCSNHNKRFHSWNCAARIYQSTVRIPWIRLAGNICLLVTCLLVTMSNAAIAGAPDDLVKAVKDHLAAGEFGLASDLALTAPTADEQAALAELVTAAQVESGDAKGADRTVRRLPPGTVRDKVAKTKQRQMAGGGNLANPQPLMQMIMQLTGGDDVGSPWRAIDGEGGDISWERNGVWVNPNGVLSRRLASDMNNRLTEIGAKSRNAVLNNEMAVDSKLRFISMARLENEVAARLKEGQSELETMRHLAGLSRIQYIIMVPEENDILIGGPAEGWKYNEKGVAVGKTSGRPTLHLDDLVTILRTFSKDGDKTFGCSINPRQEGLKATKEFVEGSQKAGELAPGATGKFLKEIQSRMGLQDVQIYGVPTDSRVASVLVAADYRMKLIGIGKLDAGKAIPSIFALLPKFPKHQTMPLDALRWWLTMKYDSILHSPDRQVFEICGSSVLVQSEDQFVKTDGSRIHTGQASPVNEAFAKNFTDNYADLAKRDLVFAELQNVFDLGMVAALIHSEHLLQKANWKPGCFGVDGEFQTVKVPVSKTVDSVINHKVYNEKNIVVQVAGGVRGDVLELAASKSRLHKEAQELKSIPAQAKPVKLPAGRWWWDAK